MKEKTLGMMIAELRKSCGMTQAELAEKMGVTDKAVSKWERDLSCPDIVSFPHLAEILGVSVDELMQSKSEKKMENKSIGETVSLVLKCVTVGMGVGVVALSIMNKIEIKDALIMLGAGLSCLAINSLKDKE